MRSYAQVVPTFWTRGSGKKLRKYPHAQVLALYLMTAPASNLIGLYYVPLISICHETGLTEEQVRDALPRVVEIAKYDFEAELAWLPECARYQIGEVMAPRDKRRAAVERELAMVSGHAFAGEFLDRYGERFGLRVAPPEQRSRPTHPAAEAPDESGSFPKPKGHAAAVDAPSEGLPASQKPPFPDPDPAPVRDPVPDPERPGRARTDAEPRNLEQALAMPIRERAALIEQRSDLAMWVHPEQWPEVKQVAEALQAAAGGGSPRLGSFTQDAGLRTVVGLFAAGYTTLELVDVAGRVPRETWWRDGGRRRGLSSLTIEVVRRALPEARAASPESPEESARRAAERTLEQVRLNAQALEDAKRLGLVDEHGNRVRRTNPSKLTQGIG